MKLLQNQIESVLKKCLRIKTSNRSPQVHTFSHLQLTDLKPILQLQLKASQSNP